MDISMRAKTTCMRDPVPGYWYINRSGKLMRVRFVAYGSDGIEGVVIQYLEGHSQTISFDEWQRLELVIPRYDEDAVLLESDTIL